MTVSDVDEVLGRLVDATALICPGCHEPVSGEPPVGWPVGAEEAPGFSHRDGSVLCPDAAGRLGEPIERADVEQVPGVDAGGVRFWLTEAGERALGARTDARAGVRS